MYDAEINRLAHPVHLGAATLLRVSAEGLGTALVLIVQARTGHAAEAGFLQTAAMLPYVLAGPVLGNTLDRVRRPRLIIVLLAALYAVATAMLLLVAGRVPVALALLVAVAVGCTEPIVVALTGMLPRIVPADRLTRAYGLEAATYNVAAVAGPGLAAVLTATAGAGAAAVAIVASAALGALFLPLLRLSPGRSLPEEPGEKETRQPAGDVLVGGLMVLARNRVLRALTAATTLAFLGVGGLAVIAVLLAEQIGSSASAGGALLSAFSVGALLGSLGAARWLSARHAEWVLLAGMAAFGGSIAMIVVVPSLPWATVWFVVAGIADGPVFAATLVVRQREAPADRLGQVNTTAGSLKIGSAAMGASLAGIFADSIGPDGLLLGLAALQFAGAGLGLALLPRPGRRPAELVPACQRTER